MGEFDDGHSYDILLSITVVKHRNEWQPLLPILYGIQVYYRLPSSISTSFPNNFWTPIATPGMERVIMGVKSLAQEHNTIILPELESQCYILQSRESNINPLCVNNI